MSFVRVNGNLKQTFDEAMPESRQSVPKVPGRSTIDAESLNRRWQLIDTNRVNRERLVDLQTMMQMTRYRHNIENFIGTVKVPVGLAGPLRVDGLHAQGDYYIPLATTEAALVASYSRGAQLIGQAGGCAAMLLRQSVGRTPGFAFSNLQECGQFVGWAMSQLESFKQQAAGTTRYGQLVNVGATIEGNHVYLNFEFLTGDASGQNMVTIATQAICDYIDAYSPVSPQYYFLDANLSGDKKTTARSFSSVRGKKVSAEVTIPAELVERDLHTTPAKMVDYWRMSAIGSSLSGAMGLQGHYANGLAALYIACGQDAACIAESAVGVTRFELTQQRDLYASVTLPNLMVGTVGGGTGLPSQRACLEIMGLFGPGKANALAELCAALCLAGELSIAGAMCSGDFARAHQTLGRGS